MMKICNGCKINKPDTDFGTKQYKSGFIGLQWVCLDCRRAYFRNRYPLRETKYNTRASVDRRRFEQTAWIDQLKSSTPCADCGKYYPSWVMDFDHLPQFEKKFEINRSRTRSKESVQKEIDKCEIVCSNCHRERTHQRQ